MSESNPAATLKLRIHDLSRAGSGVGRAIDPAADPRIVFVPLTAPGDEVEATLTLADRRYSEAELVCVTKASDVRVIPRCPVFGICGGCTWQHLPYSLQWDTKRLGVLHALRRTCGDVPNVPLAEFPADDPWNYRNRIQLRYENGDLGFFRRGSRALVPIERCDVARPELNAALAETRSLPALARTNGMQKIELDVGPGGNVRTAVNERHAAFGFRQVNDAQNAKLQAWVSDSFTVRAHVLDLFGGYGNLSLPFQDRMVGVDCVDVTVPDASAAPSPAYRYHRGETLPWLKRRVREFSRRGRAGNDPIVAILDPPREGLHTTSNGILEAFRALRVERFVLVGCEADAFARDVARIKKGGWILESLAVFDFFPQTPHIESAARFVRVDTGTR